MNKETQTSRNQHPRDRHNKNDKLRWKKPQLFNLQPQTTHGGNRTATNETIITRFGASYTKWGTIS